MTFPNNQDMERALLGCIMSDPEIHGDVFDRVRSDDFYSERHRIIYGEMLGLYESKTPVDMVTVGSSKGVEDRGMVSYVSEIAEFSTSANWDYYAKELRRLSEARRGIKAGHDMIAALSAPGPVEEAIDQAQQIVLGLDVVGVSDKQFRAHTLASESMARYTMLSKNGRGMGIPTGYLALDELLGGGFRKEFVILAGRPGQGKSALMGNMAQQQSARGYGVGIISLEMKRDELWDRFVANKASINTVRLANGRLQGEHWDAIVKANEALSKCRLIIDDSPGGQPVSEVKRMCRSLKKRGADIVYIDQLSKIRGKGKSLYETNTYVVNELSPLAKELDIPIVLLAQLNREVAALANKRPSLHHLKATGALEEDADIVLFVHREYAYTQEEGKEYDAIVDLAKHRGGPCGPIELRWIGKYTRFENP